MHVCQLCKKPTVTYKIEETVEELLNMFIWFIFQAEKIASALSKSTNNNKKPGKRTTYSKDLPFLLDEGQRKNDRSIPSETT